LLEVLYELEGRPEVSTGIEGHPFVDVDDGDLTAKAIAWGYAVGLVSGVGNSQFESNALLTREQAAKVFCIYVTKNSDIAAELPGNVGGSTDVSDWARQYVGWAVTSGVITLKDGVTIAPQEYISYNELASMLRDLLNLLT
jgi:hypothetical protein